MKWATRVASLSHTGLEDGVPVCECADGQCLRGRPMASRMPLGIAKEGRPVGGPEERHAFEETEVTSQASPVPCTPGHRLGPNS